MTTRPFDHGELNIPFSKRRQSIDSMIDAGLRENARMEKIAEKVIRDNRKSAREAEATRPKLTREDIAGAWAVRDQSGWHYVARANTKTVTVNTAYSWQERIPFDKILEVRK